jgi:hypothetical protein
VGDFDLVEPVELIGVVEALGLVVVVGVLRVDGVTIVVAGVVEGVDVIFGCRGWCSCFRT